MNKNYEASRKKLQDKYGVNVEQYMGDNTAKQLESNLGNVFSFGQYIVLPVVTSFIIFLVLAISLGNKYNSVVLGILFFVFSIPIFIGAGFIGGSISLKKMVKGINYIYLYTTNLTKSICKGITKKGNVNIKSVEIFQLTLYGIILPVVHKIVKHNFFGLVIIKLMNNIIFKSTNEISEFEGQMDAAEIAEDFEKKIEIKSNGWVSKSSKALNIIGIIAIFFSVVLLLILWLGYFISSK